MSAFYTNVVQNGNSLLVRRVEDGRRVQQVEKYEPVLFVQPSRHNETPSGYTDIHGNALQPIFFPSIKKAKGFLDEYKSVENFQIYGNTRFAYQYITEHYPEAIDFDLDHVKIITLDIETTSELGFPDAQNPLEELLVITLQDYKTKELFSFGTKPFDTTAIQHVKNKHLVQYVHCKNEVDLLKKFLKLWQHLAPDVITGWNIQFFDIPYLHNRIIRVLGEDAAKRLSPWEIVRTRDVTKNDRQWMIYDLLGISTLDYLELYQKFTYSRQESYKLDHIASVELDKKKLETEYDTFKDFYTHARHPFVEYPLGAVELVDELEDKMKLIEMAISMAYYAKCNYADVFSAVRTWDCILYNHLLEKNIVVPLNEDHEGRKIAGAYVKEPVPGKYHWICSFDATSLYPSIIMQYNMSPETLVQEPPYMCTPEILLEKKFTQTDDLVQKNYAMAANGYCYRRDKMGLFPEVVEKIFADRVAFKNKMIDAERRVVQLEEAIRTCTNPADEAHLQQQLIVEHKKVSRYNNFQMARKIQLNSLYGSMANRFFRFYDPRIAEGITLTGQYIIQLVTQRMNEYLNKFFKTSNVDYAFYSDTDSCYITLGAAVQSHLSATRSSPKLVELIDTICREKIIPAIDRVSREIAQDTHAFQNKISFKREAIAESGIWVSKKRYAMLIHDKEGVRFEEPKLKVLGLEIVRSSTPSFVRKQLKDAMKIILMKNERDLQGFIRDLEDQFSRLPVEKIAFPRGVNGIVKYSSPHTIYAKKTPIHVRAAILHNRLLDQLDLGKKYEKIRDGDKIKFVFLKVPNPIHENVVAFFGSFPLDFNLLSYVDYDKMFEKTFLDPLEVILSSLNWSVRPAATLNDLF